MEKTVISSSPPSSSTGGRICGGGGDERKYKGVRKRKWGKWVSEIRLPNSRERIWLGSHDSPEKAARAFDAALFCLRGRGAKFNFPNCPPDIPGAGSLTRQEIQLAAARFANEAPVVTRPDRAEEDVSAVDWSFLDPPDPNNEGVSDFGFYSELHYYDSMAVDLFPAPPLEDDDDVVGETEGDASTHHSFLWNF